MSVWVVVGVCMMVGRGGTELYTYLFSRAISLQLRRRDRESGMDGERLPNAIQTSPVALLLGLNPRSASCRIVV